MGLPLWQVPDELMIDWGNTPVGAHASVYVPSLNVDDILDMARRMYSSHRLARLDDHTLRCVTGGITYIPIPPGISINYPGLLSVELPSGLPKGYVYTAVVRQVTNAFGWTGSQKPPAVQIRSRHKASASTHGGDRRLIEWRRVIGAFQLTIPVKHSSGLLLTEERQLSVLRWIGESIPYHSRWYPVFQRYLQKLGGRVKSFGGDPGKILPSPTGHGTGKPGKGGHGEHHPHHGHEHEHGWPFTGKIACLVFDRFGDFEGFLLDTEDGDRKFLSREKDVAELAERAWRERLRITVWADKDGPCQVLSVVIHRPPARFTE
jgi:hypothetical protein